MTPRFERQHCLHRGNDPLKYSDGLGVTVGRDEGLELKVLGLVTGFDLRHQPSKCRESAECPETVSQRHCHAAEALELAQRESLPDFRLAWLHAAE